MAGATYVVEIDTLRTGNFAGMYDDISTYVRTMRWNEGMQNPYDTLANPAQLELTIDNIGGEFRQDNLGGELVINGSFTAWTADNPDSWTVTGESGSNPYVNEVGGGQGNGGAGTGLANLYTTSSALSISQTILTIGLRYKVTLDIDGVYAIGGIVCKCGSTAISPVYHLGGRKTFYFWATATSFTIAADNGNGTVDVTIDNVSVKPADRYYMALRQGTLVRMRTTLPSAQTLFIGKIMPPKVTAGSYGQRSVTIMANDAMSNLNDIEFRPTLHTDTTADVAMNEIFDEGTIPWPYAHNYWMVGVEGCSELGTTTTLYTHVATSFDTGSTTFDFMGDNLDRGNGISAMGFIRDLMDAELGRFFFAPRTSKYTFHRRHRDILNTTSVASFNENDFEESGTEYGQFDDLVNHAMVNFIPREVGPTGTVLWASSGVITLRQTSERAITARYRDAEAPSARVGAQNVITPFPGVDFAAVSQLADTPDSTIAYVLPESPIIVGTTSAHGFSTADKVIIRGVKGIKGINGGHTITVVDTVTMTLDGTTGKGAYEGGGTVELRVDDLNSKVSIAIEKGAASAKIKVINHANQTVYIPHLQLRGTPLIVFDKRIVESRNGDSARDYEYAQRTYSVPAITDDIYAQSYADWMVYKFRDPLFYFRSVSFNANKTDTRLTQALTRTIGNRITIGESWSGHSQDYFIVGALHNVGSGGEQTHDTTWILKPAERESFWVLSSTIYSVLGQTTRLVL